MNKNERFFNLFCLVVLILGSSFFVNGLARFQEAQKAPNGWDNAGLRARVILSKNFPLTFLMGKGRGWTSEEVANSLEKRF